MSVDFWRLWGWPLFIGLLSVAGLVSGLVADGWGDAVSWVALGVPVLFMGWYGGRKRR